MGGGGESMETSNHSNADNRRPRRDRAIDQSPPFSRHTSSGLFEATLKTQPLHHLCTLTTELEGTSVCPPQIIFHKFIASVSFGGKLKLFELDSKVAAKQQVPEQVKPKWSCLNAVPEGSRVVSMTTCSSPQDSLLGFVVLATVEGDIGIVEVSLAAGFHVVRTFATHILNTVSAACWLQDENFHVAVGSKSGIVEEWRIPFHPEEKGAYKQLLWKGTLGATVHSMLAIHPSSDTVNLTVCISQRPQGRIVPSVEVLNRDKLIEDWKNTPSSVLDLSTYCMWPEAGCEWSTVSVADESHGTNIQCHINERTWAAGLADGSVGILTSLSNKSWGLDAVSFALAHPPIGIASIVWNGSEFVALCLRGGTVYLMPYEKEEAENVVPVFLSPIRSDIDNDLEFLHGFTAGNIALVGDPVSDGRLSTESVPILVYSGDGGVMEVYTGLLPQSSTEGVTQHLVLDEMFKKGIISSLIEVLLLIEDGSTLLESEEWRNAHHEVKENRDGVSAYAILANQSNSFNGIRTLLLNLASTKIS